MVPGQNQGYVLTPCESMTDVDLRAAFAPMDFREIFQTIDFRAMDCLVQAIEQSEVILAPMNRMT
jgi:hypothetical protein